MNTENPLNESTKWLARLIADFRVSMLTTVDTDGSLHSRPMVAQYKEFDGNLWFFTHAHTHKVVEVKNCEQVNLSYASWEDGRYVSISGIAELVCDPEKLKEMWNPNYKDWFPQGLDDPDLALLKVRVEEAEYWDASGKVMVQIGGSKARSIE